MSNSKLPEYFKTKQAESACTSLLTEDKCNEKASCTAPDQHCCWPAQSGCYWDKSSMTCKERVITCSNLSQDVCKRDNEYE